MRTKSFNLFTDTSSLVALYSPLDINHEKALSLAEKYKNCSYMISDYVFTEVVTIISQKVGKDESIKVGELLRNFYTWIKVDDNIIDAAWVIFKKQKSKNVSFVDCTTFAIYQDGLFDKAFSFDSDFKTNKVPVV